MSDYDAFLRLYAEELDQIRRRASDFGRRHANARQLDIDDPDRVSSDPWVERLLEGTAYLAARVRAKLDAGYPRVTQQLLNTIYPSLWSQSPSTAIVEFEATENLKRGYPVPSGRPLFMRTGERSAVGEPVECEFRTSHEIQIWPLQIAGVSYTTGAEGVRRVWGQGAHAGAAALEIVLRTIGGVTLGGLTRPSFDAPRLERLPIYLHGSGDLPLALFEQLCADRIAMRIGLGEAGEWSASAAPLGLSRVGFAAEEALVPPSERCFEGYRYLREFFMLRERFRFVTITRLAEHIADSEATEMRIAVLFDRARPELSGLKEENLRLHCTPAVNLFEKRDIRVSLASRRSEYHVSPDPTRPTDYEIFAVKDVIGKGTRSEGRPRFYPFYDIRSRGARGPQLRYYTLVREAALPADGDLSADDPRRETVRDYPGSDVALSLVDAMAAPYSTELDELRIDALCTNRDLPLHLVRMRVKDFAKPPWGPVTARCLVGPTIPRPAPTGGEVPWQLVSHLSLNHMSLAGPSVVGSRDGPTAGDVGGAGVLREILSLYCANDREGRELIERIRSIDVRPEYGVAPGADSSDLVRGMAVRLRFRKRDFAASGAFVLASVLERFLARHVATNSFVRTIVQTEDWSENSRTSELDTVMEWPAIPGSRHIF